MRSRQRGRSPFSVGAITLAVVGIVCYFGFTKSNPFATHFEIQAAFRNANELKPNSFVRIGGVNVGRVKSVKSLGNGETGALVTMRIEDKGLPIHRDATAKIRPRIFLEGNYFVDISPGTPSAPSLDDGDTLPINQTADPVQLGDVLKALQADTREELRQVLQVYGGAINSSGGRGFNRSIRYWEGAYRDSAIVNNATLGLEDGDLSGYIRDAAKVTAALDRSPEALKGLITDFALTADAFADEQLNLSRAIHELPRTLGQGRTTLLRLNQAFPPLRRFIKDFRPAVRSSGPALDATLPFVREMRRLVSTPELRGLTRDLRPLVPDLVELNRGGVPLQEQQRRFSSCNVEVIQPWQQDRVPDPHFPSAGKVFQEGVKWMPGIAGESRSFDANGQYVRSLAKTANFAYAIGDDRFYLTDSPLQGAIPPKSPQPPFTKDVVCETQQPPDLRATAAAPPAGLRINQNAPGAQERRDKALDVAVDWLRDNLRMSGLDRNFRISREPLRADEVDDVIRGLGDEAVKP